MQGKSKGLPILMHSPTPCVEKRAIWHNKLGRIVHEVHSGMGVDNTYTYNTFGRLSSVASNGSTRTFAYNSFGRWNPPATQPLWAVVHVCGCCKLARGKSLAICTKKAKKFQTIFKRVLHF